MALRVTTRFTGPIPGAPYFSTMYTGGTAQADADAAVAAVGAFWFGMAPSMRNTLAWAVLPEVEEVDTNTGQTTGIFGTAGATGSGSDSGDPLAWATQGLLRWRTGVFINGREVRGRTFIPAPTEVANTLGEPTQAYLTRGNTEAAELIDSLSTAGSLVIYSPTHFQSSVVQSASTWNQWAVLRSRRD